VYQIEALRQLLRDRRRVALRELRWPRVARNVVLLGLVSLLTDLSAEMVATVLPLYLVFTLGLSPFQFGVLDGLYQGVTAFVRLGGGFAADRWRRYKEVCALGYGISAACKIAFLAAGSALGGLAAIIVVDRAGKGIRTAPRDALISLSSPRGELATAFGVHRAMDTAGAMLGPLVAFALLTLASNAYDAVFVVSFCVGLVGLSILVLFVRNPVSDESRVHEWDVSLRAVAGLLRAPSFVGLTFVAGILAVFTVSDGFLYLSLQQSLEFDARFLPLLFTGTAAVYMLLALPCGRLADRFGHGRVFLGGYALLLSAYLLLLLPSFGTAEIFVYVAFLGAYYAATDGVLMALASAMLPASVRGSGLALIVTATSFGRLLASMLFGALWTALSVETAVLAFAAGLLVAICTAVIVMIRLKVTASFA
jgi:MFS family permease